jgi:protein TonB
MKKKEVNMSKKIFETMLMKPKPTQRWLFFPISIIFHGLLVAAIITVPLIMADSHFPEVKVVDVFMVAPKPPPPPPPPKGSGDSGKIKKKPDGKKVRHKPQSLKSKEFMAPPEIPNEIKEEPIDFSELGGGVPGIAADGAPDWGENNPIFDTNVNPKAKPVKISQIEMPKLIKRAAPHYPIAARRAHIQGIVKIEASTDIYGRVVNVKVIEGHPLLRNAVVHAVKQWVYEPYMINGMPKPVKFKVDIHFRLQK